MKWVRFRVRTNSASEDIIVSAMTDIGLCGAEIEDRVPLTAGELEGLFVDEVPLKKIEDDTGEADLACISFYAELSDTDSAADSELRVKLGDGEEPALPGETADRMRQVLDELRQFSDIGEGTVTISVTEDIDWRDNWKQYFHRFYIDDVLILPSWEKMDASDRLKAKTVLHLDPGAAFGTGLHETTKLAIRALRRVIDREESILDVGTGSGILSILALMFGAGRAIGVDLDPLAVSAARENRDGNGFDENRMQVVQGDLIGDEGFRQQVLELGHTVSCGFDVIIANILPNVLIPLASVLPPLLAENGALIYSGILKSKRPEVTEALNAAGFAVTEEEELGEWCSLTARLAGTP